MDKTPYLGLNLPAPEDYADIAVLNEDLRVIDRAMQATGDIDCGTFEEGGLEAHSGAAYAHGGLLVDGNAAAPSATGDTLAEHEVDPQAHANIQLDGNNTSEV